MSVDDDLDLEPVSPDNNPGEVIKGSLPKKKYLFGTICVDTITYR